MSYTSWSVVFGEQPSAAKWNILGTNDASFDAFITGARYKTGTFTVSANGDTAITGLGFTPKAVMFVAFTAAADTVSSTTNAGIGIGFATAVGTEVSGGATNRNTHGGAVDIEATSCIVVDTIAAGGGSQSKSFVGDLKSLDSDGFTITISSYSVSSAVLYLAFG